MTDAALIDADNLRALAARLIVPDMAAPELIVFPVRHHSPACAWQLRRLFAERTPCEVLVEGPRGFTPLIPMLADAQAKMPLAIYTYAVARGEASPDEASPDGANDGANDDKRQERRRAAYYPFCDYSPELVALREAQARGIPARFIDLDFAEQAQIEDAQARAEHDDDIGESLLDERHYRRSVQLQALAERLGCRGHEELWEHLFELSAATLTLEEHIARIAAYCRLSRLDSSDAELLADGTLQREAEMAWHVREALARRKPEAGPVLVVLGGFHAVVMPDLLADLASTPSLRRPKIARGAIVEEGSALIRYGFERLDRLNGYAAGMTAPAWHQRLWEDALKSERLGDAAAARLRREAALTLLTDIAAELRDRHRVPLPMPALAAAYEQTLRLAQLRRRAAPVREDVLDAVLSCFVKGEADADGAIVLEVARKRFCGTATGSVPAGAPVPPLVRDVAWRLRRQRLKVDDAEPRRAQLDLYRRAAHRVTSRLLHGLSLLGVPFALRTAGPDFVNGIGLDRLQEHWDYSYSAATEAALVEASVYGVTLPLAVANRFAARLDRAEADGHAQNARTAAALLAHACVLGLHDHLPRVVALLRQAIGADAAFDSVAAAIATLGLLWESREPLEARDLDTLPGLLVAAYERAIYLGRDMRGAQCEPAAAIPALMQLRERLIGAAGQGLDAALYWAMLDDLQQHHDHPQIRGAAAGLRYSAGRLDDAGLAQALDGHFRGLAQPEAAVGFLRGLLQTAREAAWQQPALLDVLDTLMRDWGEDIFVRHLPELRLAFATMTPKETDRIATAVAQLHGTDDLGPLVDREFGEDDVRAALLLSGTLSEVLTGDGLDAWLGGGSADDNDKQTTEMRG
jgi:Family of unknown function (DUF5682)